MYRHSKKRLRLFVAAKDRVNANCAGIGSTLSSDSTFEDVLSEAFEQCGTIKPSRAERVCAEV